MAKSKTTTTVRSLLQGIPNHHKITLRKVGKDERQLVKGTISEDAPVRFTPRALEYARTKLASIPDTQITVNALKIVLSVQDWTHVAQQIPLLEERVSTPDTPVARTVSDDTASGSETTTAKEVFTLNQTIEELIENKGPQRDKASAYSEEEKAMLATFAGYGGLEKYGEDKSGRGLLYEFYTPDAVVQAMWKLCIKHGYTDGPVLEPSAGSGRFLRYAPGKASLTAYEVNPTTTTILRVLYPEAQVHNAHFETLFIENNTSLRDKTDHLPRFDLAIGNPPYGEFTGRYAGMGERKYTGMKAHIDYFMYRCLDVVKPGGLCCMLVGAEPANGGKRFLQKGMYPGKARIMEKAVLLEAHALPEGVFDRSSSIGEIILLRKY